MTLYDKPHTSHVPIYYIRYIMYERRVYPSNISYGCPHESRPRKIKINFSVEIFAKSRKRTREKMRKNRKIIETIFSRAAPCTDTPLIIRRARTVQFLYPVWSASPGHELRRGREQKKKRVNFIPPPFVFLLP